MHVRVTTIQGSADREAEIKRYVEEQVIPMARQRPGFQGGYWMVDRASGKGLGITLWESEEAMRASEAAGEQSRAGSAQAAGGAVQGVERFEIIAQA